MPDTPTQTLEFPTWRQPVGTWRARGAHACAVRTGLGLVPGKVPDPPPIDDHGNGLWHYWANSPSPHETFLALFQAVGRAHCDHLSRDGAHPWHYLLHQGNPRALEAWVGHIGLPADPGPTVNGDTFAHCAAWSGNPQAVALFQDQDLAHINAQDSSGLTALMVGIHRGGQPMAQALLLAGADPMALDGQGRNALHHAAQYGDVELVALLEDAGGDCEAVDGQGLCARSIAHARRGTTDAARQALAEHWGRRWAARMPF